MKINLEDISILAITGYLVLIIILVVLVYYNVKLRKYKKSVNKELLNLNKENDALKEELWEVETIITTLDDAIICSNLDGTITRWNEGAKDIYGYTKEEAIGKDISIISKDENHEEVEWLAHNIKKGKVIKSYETERYRKDEQKINVSLTLSPIKDSEGNILYIAGIDRDITELINQRLTLKRSYDELSVVYNQLAETEEELRYQIQELKESEMALKVSEERYKLALDGANDAIWELDLIENSLFISDKWESISGIKLENQTNNIKYMNKYVHPDDVRGVIRALNDHILGKKDTYEVEFRIKTGDGSYKWVNNRGKVLKDSLGVPLKVAGSITDIDERKRYQEKIKYLAYYDTLTGLPNRTLIKEKLDNIIRESNEEKKKFALVSIDIDNFKLINDILSHDFGDQVIKNVAHTIKKMVPKSAIVGRIGGDEFMVIIKDVRSIRSSIDICEGILKSFKKAIKINDTNIYTGISIGICIYPYHASTSKELFTNADAALYESKKNGRNQITMFNKLMSKDTIRRGKIEKSLRGALDKEELVMFYQPQMNIKTRRVDGYEALLRWNSEELGFVSPGEFIPIAEEAGLISHIGQWVIKDVCRQIRCWKDKNLEVSTVAVNISAIQFHDSQLIEDILYILQQEGLSPKDLEIEITESILMNFYEKNMSLLNRLKDLNFSLALDDFGTGYSSLNYLSVMPINKLKIDKSFIDSIDKNKKDKSIVEGIINLSHNMGIKVVAEGVEDYNQLKLLEDMGCDNIQGYIFSKPLPAKDVEKFMTTYI
ncbi:sensor domain-containing protein [Clostridium algidicarnis]|uniref:sensor domain-containing protein n=1 Tax=Clostridium algidicarnis TaxID=37659 RepID=UPI001C0CA9BE|nr:EAL domain-containing protein [Clostridium algidicarnis]MBU3209273.1 EAL domain-containing protein [Clostridium algidicarnis]MBU3227988.1 EAL domain-containing protein [Clostridium algidicarnis]MBU3251841.1 EAL domain-containing protein [Clostridium algidicarnis]